jgi:hypothetical protein
MNGRRRPGRVLLVIGRDEEGFWLLEVDHNNTTTFYEDRGYQAIGSGGSAAFVAQAGEEGAGGIPEPLGEDLQPVSPEETASE